VPPQFGAVSDVAIDRRQITQMCSKLLEAGCDLYQSANVNKRLELGGEKGRLSIWKRVRIAAPLAAGIDQTPCCRVGCGPDKALRLQAIVICAPKLTVGTIPYLPAVTANLSMNKRQVPIARSYFRNDSNLGGC
jgi:hypothetical protein